ncbi:MAG: hypothetical protein L6V93_05015 [Clostridiales bacterium]|nr:MAG: hypothetical protein L6V93_05015 [Clostridiales bacterium]
MLAQSFAEGKITSVDENIGNIDVLNKSPLKDVYAEKYITDTVKQKFRCENNVARALCIA